MELQSLIEDERTPLVHRLTAVLGGDRHAAEDLAQEALIRAWQRMPESLDGGRRHAWLARTARNLAIDELRRRSRQPLAPQADGATLHAAEPDAAREALAHLSPHERFALLLRFEAGFSHAEIAALLRTTEEAARKRVSRARAAFVHAYRSTRACNEPLILLAIASSEPAEPYVRWLEDAGARVRRLAGTPRERDLALADGVVFSGGADDIDPRLYGERWREVRGEPDIASDRLDLAALAGALALDVPFVGICRGAQLLNIATGGSLYQDVHADGLTRHAHSGAPHLLRTAHGGLVRRLAGSTPRVHSEHHQAVRRLGRGLQVTAHSADGVVETIERADRRFALGLQWHPERGESTAGARVAEALVEAAAARA
jgi:putative glutamine amidotransferase